ncbi:MAG: TonB-dependent receptor [Pseudomonadales bacterium]|nr:TonB-dependent receptor [Pseudomonadales bacterium]
MKLVSSKKAITINLAFSLSAVATTSLQAAEQAHDEDALEEIVVTAPFEQSEAETALPIGILSGEALREKVLNSLGDTLKNEIGVASASFGTGVGQPIIRGQTGNRVSILQNGVSLTDASNVSPDHANGVEAMLADRIEVIRGPSALLYGSGAVGGVVNVIDNRIPDRLIEETLFQLEQSHNSGSEEDKTVFRLDAAVGNIGIHLDGFKRENNNVEVKGFAIDEDAIYELEEHIASVLGEEHEEEHEEEEFENTRGFIGNSDGEAQGATAGFSYVVDRGFVGFSISELDNEYGLPPGSHAHHEEEHEEGEVEEEGHEEEHHEDVEFVRVDLEQTRYDFKGQYDFQAGWIQSISANIGITDYRHQEIEFFGDGEQEVGTLFDNEGTESRFTLTHVPVGYWTGVWGLQLSDSEFSAVGEEAFVPKSDISSMGVFGVERFTQGNFTGELGVRFENSEIDTGAGCDFDENSTSLSGSLLYDLDADSNLLLAAARSQRAPSVEELYSNVSNISCSRFADNEDLVLHAATNLLEIGNPNLDKETSNNFEFGYRRHAGFVTGEFSAYYNEIDDYIFLDLNGEEVNGQPIAAYAANDATFKGIEAEISFNLFETAQSSAVLSFFGDRVDAEFDRGGNVPRIPASKIGSELRYFGNDWSMHLHVTHAIDQNDPGRLELETDSYTLVSVYADYHWQFAGDSEVKLFVRGDNLLNEEVRNHASFLKNFAPEPGRAITLGVRYEY